MQSMQGKVALITGAASGIGRAAARIFCREGANVVVVDINDKGGRETVSMVQDSGGLAAYVHADVTDEADVRHMVEVAHERLDRMDGTCNNGGYPRPISDAARTK